MKILYMASEVVPFAKTGGLGDVAGSLPLEIQKFNHDIRITMPYYRQCQNYFNNNLDQKIDKILDNGEVILSDTDLMTTSYSFHIWKSSHPMNNNLIIYFIDIPEFFDRSELYVDSRGKGYKDDAERYISFNNTIDFLIKQINWIPDIIHLNDWHTGYLPIVFKTKSEYKNTKFLFTIHNMAYQGIFKFKTAEKLGLVPPKLFPNLWHKNSLNLLKAGITSSDFVTTVSKRYRDELLTSDFGYGLESYLLEKNEQFIGILNGVDYSRWNPKTDDLIPEKYNYNDLTGKFICKQRLLEEFKKRSESLPLFGMVTRLGYQKGIDLVIESLPKFLKSKRLTMIIVGTGRKSYENQLKELENKYPDQLRVIVSFNNQLAHQIEAGADFFLMPSRYEPCGLNQMYSLKYGTFPVVRETGGLADTVLDLTKDSNLGNGFSFKEYSSEALSDAITRALRFYNDLKPGEIDIYRSKIMQEDYSWEKSALKYRKLYKQILLLNKN